MTLSHTFQTLKEIQDPSQNPNYQKVNKTATDQSQGFSAKLNSTNSSTHNDSQSSNNENLLTLSKNSLVSVKDTRISNDSTKYATKNEFETSLMKNTSPSKSNSITLPNLSNLNLDKKPSNDLTQNLIEDQSRKASHRVRKTSVDHSQTSLHGSSPSIIYNESQISSMKESSSSQLNHVTSQHNHSNLDHNKEPLNVKVQKTIKK